ncbi:Protein of unknown function [Pseudoxanthomonas sp. GM95]|nr:Protein of unknown function [Pseudoxanthomonas sp. GM95]
MASSAADPLRHAMKLDALEQQLRPCLPPALAEHCRLANITGDRLVFVVDSPVWNAKLRLAANELIEVARSVGLGVNSVTSKVSMQPLFPSASANAPIQQQSPVAREALKAALAMLDESPVANTAAVERGPRPGQKR